MPFGDGTGPRGMGPMTGRGVGYCTGSSRHGFANPAPARRWFSPVWIGDGDANRVAAAAGVGLRLFGSGKEIRNRRNKH